MPRRARITLPGVAVHVIHRGNDKAECFFSDEDRSFYLFHLGRYLPRARCALHAYCLMSNHVHLLLTAASASGCALLMKGIGQLYAQYVNKQYGRSGYLWEGRFKSCLVQSEQYLLRCYCYVELNPVRPSLVRHPAEYRWSSYSANALGKVSSLVTPHEQYVRLGRTPEERQAAYRGLVASLTEEQVDAIRAATNTGYPLGDRRFIRSISAATGARTERGAAGRPPKAPKADGQLDLL
jgi:putative transposase